MAIRIVRLGAQPLTAVMDALSHSDVVLDARAMRLDWSRGDWGLIATRTPRAVVLCLDADVASGHDHAHGDGAHARAIGTLRDVGSAGLNVIVTTTITRSNARSAMGIAAELTRARVAAWSLSLAQAEDAAAAVRLPSLGVAMPHVLRGADAAGRTGIEVCLRGFPRCVLGPYARWAIATAAEAHGVPCDDCTARRGCPGLAPSHRERFGARELRHLDVAPAEARSPTRDALRATLLALDDEAPARTSAD
ncbi:MAG: hypothetical protein J0L92_17895 [Deltaproteobacteria bacterium]|nr:hypothetical protein [Deltaproteobacteria bacterium]